jgi:hypothetical protein
MCREQVRSQKDVARSLTLPGMRRAHALYWVQGPTNERQAIEEADEMCALLQALRDLLVAALALIGAGLWVAALSPTTLSMLQRVLLRLWPPVALTTAFVIFREIAWHRRFARLIDVSREPP